MNEHLRKIPECTVHIALQAPEACARGIITALPEGFGVTHDEPGAGQGQSGVSVTFQSTIKMHSVLFLNLALVGARIARNMK